MRERVLRVVAAVADVQRYARIEPMTDTTIDITKETPKFRIDDPITAIKYVAERTDTIMLAFSGGKDSVCCWLRLREYFAHVIPVFRYWVPDLEFQEQALRYYEDFFGEPIVRVPHRAFLQSLGLGVFQTPVTYQVCEAYDVQPVEMDEQITWIAEDHGIEYPIVAVGLRHGDSVNRYLVIKKVGCLNLARHVLYPIAEMDKAAQVAMIRDAGIKLSPEYGYIGRSFDGLQYSYVKMLRDHFPRDYERVVSWFPLVELEFARREIYAKRFY